MDSAVSIIIPSYGSYDYVMSCVESIQRQTYFKDNDNYEILIGIDGYHDMVDIVCDFVEDFSNVKAFVLKENSGKFITINTLLQEAKHDTIICFDSDDMMYDNMVEEGVKHIDDYGIVRFGSYNYFEDIRRPLTINTYPTNGVLMFTRAVLDKLGGFKPWRIEADNDFVARYDGDIWDIEEPLYYKMLHPDSLFYNKEYGFHTPYARACGRMVGKGDSKIRPEVCDYTEGIDTSDMDVLPLTIVISAYNSQDFIEECLDSIESQTYFDGNDNYEILVGVDGCTNTLDKLLEIRGRYRNLKIYANDRNYGVYATINALMDRAEHDIILRFDADDVMKSNMVKRGMYYVKDNDIVMFGYDVFYGNIDKVNIQKFRCAEGVIFVKKSLFKKAGGFRPWPCAADSEFIGRVKRNSTIKRTRARLFYRRLHDDSLTRDMQTGYKSNTRKKYKDMIRMYASGEDFTIDMVKAKQKEL